MVRVGKGEMVFCSCYQYFGTEQKLLYCTELRPKPERLYIAHPDKKKLVLLVITMSESAYSASNTKIWWQQELITSVEFSPIGASKAIV